MVNCFKKYTSYTPVFSAICYMLDISPVFVIACTSMILLLQCIIRANLCVAVLWLIIRSNLRHQNFHTSARTRKLCYRKDDRAMRPIGALKIFGTP